MRDGVAINRRRWALVAVHPGGWWFDLVLMLAFVALTVAVDRGHLLAADEALAGWADAHRPPVLYWTARVFNYLGQGGQVLMPLAVLLGAVVAWRRRSVRPLLPVAGAFVLTYSTIGPLKVWLHRAAPGFTGGRRVELFNELAHGDKAMSYPSGHVGNAIVWYGVIALLLAALLRSLGRPPLPPSVHLALRVVPPVIVFCTTTYLSFHWITDSIAGLFLGLLLTRLLARVPWDEIPLPPLRDGWERPAAL
jgi:hypothetical protein